MTSHFVSVRPSSSVTVTVHLRSPTCSAEGVQSMTPVTGSTSKNSDVSENVRLSLGRSTSVATNVRVSRSRSFTLCLPGSRSTGASGTGSTLTTSPGERVHAPHISVAFKRTAVSPLKSPTGLSSRVWLPVSPLTTRASRDVWTEMPSTLKVSEPWSKSSVNAASMSRAGVQSESSSRYTWEGPTHTGGRLVPGSWIRYVTFRSATPNLPPVSSLTRNPRPIVTLSFPGGWESSSSWSACRKPKASLTTT